MKKSLCINNNEEEKRTEGFILAGTIKEQIGSYVFTIYSYQPADSKVSSSDRLKETIKPKLLRELQRMKPERLLSTCECHADKTAGRR